MLAVTTHAQSECFGPWETRLWALCGTKGPFWAVLLAPVAVHGSCCFGMVRKQSSLATINGAQFWVKNCRNSQTDVGNIRRRSVQSTKQSEPWPQCTVNVNLYGLHHSDRCLKLCNPNADRNNRLGRCQGPNPSSKEANKHTRAHQFTSSSLANILAEAGEGMQKKGNKGEGWG